MNKLILAVLLSFIQLPALAQEDTAKFSQVRTDLETLRSHCIKDLNTMLMDLAKLGDDDLEKLSQRPTGQALTLFLTGDLQNFSKDIDESIVDLGGKKLTSQDIEEIIKQ